MNVHCLSVHMLIWLPMLFLAANRLGSISPEIVLLHQLALSIEYMPFL
ncbi:protein kinase family protein / WD-40 repeat family protein [Zea mays]|uniref:Protein kinase family protein / WD-40 repeat family protein n=1 Tax=Zea mays TaxID=4577 RepID=A0A1D6K2Z2_MAIZE|nr:protein kinase family protein / WD-40 repeat family protein [Zea mays]